MKCWPARFRSPATPPVTPSSQFSRRNHSCLRMCRPNCSHSSQGSDQRPGHALSIGCDLLIDLKNLRRDLDIQGELERSIIPNRDAVTGSVNEQATQAYHSDLIAGTRSGPAASATQQPASASSLEYAVTQA